MDLKFLLKKEWLFLIGAVALALAAAVFIYFVRPTSLTIAVGPRGGPEMKLVEAFAAALGDRRFGGLKLRVVAYDDVRDSAEALRAGKADLAVVRPDVLLPENGLTIALLRQDAAIVVAPPSAKITDMAGLARKRLGLVSGHEADTTFFHNLLAYYDLAPPAVTIVQLRVEEVEAALAAKRIDAAAILASPSGQRASDLVRAVGRASPDRKATILPIPEGEAISALMPALGPMTIPAGSFGGRPRVPDEDVKTISATYRLMSTENLSRTTAASIAEHLFGMRSRLALATPAANQLKAPDVESEPTATSAVLPNHPGAVDYYQREQESFMDRYGDWIWLILIFGGSVFSGLASLVQLFARKRREVVDIVLDRLVKILGDARQAATVGELDKLALEIDRLVTVSVRHARRKETGTRMMSALILAIDSARAAVLDRRRDLLDSKGLAREQPPAAPPDPVPRPVPAGVG